MNFLIIKLLIFISITRIEKKAFSEKKLRSEREREEREKERKRERE